MSDEFYVRRARRRSRLLWIVAAAVLFMLLALLVVRALFYDSCTHSFDRSPASVVRAYAEAIRRGDLLDAEGCWRHEAYYDLEAGCSQICLSRGAGSQYEIGEVAVGEPSRGESRASLVVTVSITCTQGGAAHMGEITLDSVAGEPPWKHWSIVHSTFGGTVAEPWCK